MTPQQANELLRNALAHAESVYRLNVVKDGEPSSTLENMQRVLEMTADLASAPTSEPGASIRDHEDFREDLLRLSSTQHRQTLKAIRKDIYDTIDRRVANAVAAALASPASPAVPAEQHRLNWDDVSKAATSANRALGQWMPEQWIQAFVKAYNKE